MKIKMFTKRIYCCALFVASVLMAQAADRLLIVGNAVWGGYSIDNSIVMLNSADAPDVFSATVYLKGAEEFKFLTTTDWGGLEYRAGETNVTLASGEESRLVSTEETDKDNKFMVTSSANYLIVCDLQKKTITATKASYQDSPINHTGLWLVGSATPGGWTIGDGHAMTQDPDNPLRFTTTVSLVPGEFKIAVNNQTGFGQTFYLRDVADEGKMVFGGDDNKWKITDPGTYRVSVDVLAMTITVERVAKVTIGDTGYATYCADLALNFGSLSDLKAYVVTGVSGSGDVLTVLTQNVNDVPAGTGLLLHGTPGSYTVPTGTGSSAYENKLVGVTTATTVSSQDSQGNNFLLANGTQRVGFYPIDGSGTLEANKAYLSLPTSMTASAKALVIDLSGQAAGINKVVETKQKTSSYYTLTGSRVDHPTKGIYIYQGKKIIKK